MARHFGTPVKPVRLAAGGRSVAAEFVCTRRIASPAAFNVVRDSTPMRSTSSDVVVSTACTPAMRWVC